MRISDWSSDVCSSDLSPQFYNVGPIDFKNNVVTGAAIEEFGDHLMLNDKKRTITELRNQLTGHVRAALNDIMVAVGITTINLIFCAGGAAVILPPSPFRIRSEEDSVGQEVVSM